MMYQDLPVFFKNMRNSHTAIGAKQELATKTIQYFWPNHNVVWINSVLTYDSIDQIFSAFPKKKDIIILQTEEDFLKFYDISILRNIIKSLPQWTDKSFLITNCIEDFKISKDIINTVFKPGILDLICYLPYKNKVDLKNIDQIKYHTAFFYRRQDYARTKIAKFLLAHKEKMFSMVYNKKFIIPNNNNFKTLIPDGECLDSPFLKIDKDQIWSDRSAFHIVVEPFNNISLNSDMHYFTPILSEKTYRAMHLKRPALIYSGTGTRQMLLKQGFDTWDWLIDWTFDSEPCPDRAFKLFLKELERLMNLDLDIIKKKLQKNKNKLEHNKQNLIRLINNYNSEF